MQALDELTLHPELDVIDQFTLLADHVGYFVPVSLQKELLREVRNGEPEHATQARVTYVVLRMRTILNVTKPYRTGDREEDNELLQHVFVHMLDKIDQINPDVEQMAGRVHTIALRVTDEQKDIRSKTVSEASTSDTEPEQQRLARALPEAIDRFLSELAFRERHAIKRRYMADDGRVGTLQEIADALDISEDEAHDILLEAKSKLRSPEVRRHVDDYLLRLSYFKHVLQTR